MQFSAKILRNLTPSSADGSAAICNYLDWAAHGFVQHLRCSLLLVSAHPALRAGLTPAAPPAPDLVIGGNYARYRSDAGTAPGTACRAPTIYLHLLVDKSIIMHLRCKRDAA